MKSLNPMDLYDVRGLLTEEEQLVQDTTARFVDEKVLPIIGECFEQGRFPKELVPEIAALGLLGSSIQGYDCAGLNGVATGSSARSWSAAIRACAASSRCSPPCDVPDLRLWLRGAEAEVAAAHGAGREDRLLRPHRAPRRFRPVQHEDHAKKKGGDWVLNGAKMWITNGTIADVAVVWAQTDEGIRGFLVEKGTRASTRRKCITRCPLRASVTSALYFDNVVVPEANVLPEREGLKGPLGCLTQARYGITWGAIGAAQACLKEVLEYTKTRELFGRALEQQPAGAAAPGRDVPPDHHWRSCCPCSSAA